jgi:hypothetical protein
VRRPRQRDGGFVEMLRPHLPGASPIVRREGVAPRH